MMLEYIFIFKFAIIALVISVILFGLSTLVVYQKPDKEKMSVYECGFHPYGDARNKFEVKYYLVGILFIIFDLEVMYVFSWVLGWWYLNIFGIIVMFLFLFLLILGFFYELILGAIDIYFLWDWDWDPPHRRYCLYAFAIMFISFILWLFFGCYCNINRFTHVGLLVVYTFMPYYSIFVLFWAWDVFYKGFILLDEEANIKAWFYEHRLTFLFLIYLVLECQFIFIYNFDLHALWCAYWDYGVAKLEQFNEIRIEMWTSPFEDINLDNYSTEHFHYTVINFLKRLKVFRATWSCHSKRAPFPPSDVCDK